MMRLTGNQPVVAFLAGVLLCLMQTVAARAQAVIGSSSHFTEGIAEIGGARVSVVKITSGRIIHRFHDTSPLSPSGRYMALFRVPFEDRYPRPGDYGEVILVDMETRQQRVVARSYGWEMQMGANVQWGADDTELYYNDVDTAAWKAFSVHYNPMTGKSRRMDGTVFMASRDGRKLVCHNQVNSVHAQSGYGVIIPDSLTAYNHGPVDTDGIYVTDTRTGQCKLLVSIKEIYEKTIPSVAIDHPEDFEYYCFKAMWNPQGTRIMTCLQWRPLSGGRRKIAVITMQANGTDIRTAVTPEQYAKGGHHMAWLPDGEHLSMNLETDRGKTGLELVTVKFDGSELKTVFSPGSGHPSFHPKGLPLIITDAYPSETSVTKGDGFVPIRLLNVETGEELVIARVQVPDVKDSSFRVDAHPTWDRSGRYVIFNGYGDNTRGVYMADLKDLIDNSK